MGQAFISRSQGAFFLLSSIIPNMWLYYQFLTTSAVPHKTHQIRPSNASLLLPGTAILHSIVLLPFPYFASSHPALYVQLPTVCQLSRCTKHIQSSLQWQFSAQFQPLPWLPILLQTANNDQVITNIYQELILCKAMS